MKTGKRLSKIIALLLVFFLTSTGAAQVLNISECKGKCCQNIPEKSPNRHFADRPFEYPTIRFDSLTLLCDPIHKLRALASKASKQDTCHSGTGPSCCELAQAGSEIEGLISTAQTRVDRLQEIGPVCILPEIYAKYDTFSTASARYSIPAKAAPPPLYLKNSTFLC